VRTKANGTQPLGLTENILTRRFLIGRKGLDHIDLGTGKCAVGAMLFPLKMVA